MGFPGAVKNPPAMQEPQETWVRSLSGEDPLWGGAGHDTHSNILAGRNRGTEEPDRLHRVTESRTRAT